MFRQIKYIALFAAAVFAGCQKLDLDTPADGSPVFSATMTLDGVAKEWQAGVDGFYLFTGFEKGTDDVYVFTGQLKKDSCGTGACGESLTVKIRDFQPILSGQPDVTQAVTPGDYPYMFVAAADTVWLLDTITTYQLTFDAGQSVVPPNSVPLFTWNLGNGTTLQPGQLATLSLPQWPQNLEMTLTMQANNQNCLSTQTRTVALPNPNGPPESCSVYIDTLLDSTGISIQNLIAVPTGSTPFSYLWQDSTTAGMWLVANAVSTIDAIVAVADAEGCTASAGFFSPWNPGTGSTYCSARFSYEVTTLTLVDSIPVVVHDSLQLSTVVVEYTDESGVLYTSVIAPQSSASAYFEILSVEDFDENENKDDGSVWTSYS
ncbi:MAG: hypothetical protein ACE5FF_17470, partial [Saprospiraceae bacterium]